jgi:hypothetical protein
MDAMVLFVILVILIGIILVCREVVCWYLKINKGLEIIERIEGRLAAIERNSTITSKIRPSSLRTRIPKMGSDFMESHERYSQ